jgi:probable F420-dependent oxidoreductase
MSTIDVLSEGRLELGLGTGWRRGDYVERGLPLDPPGTRIERLEEAVRLIKQLFAAGEEPVSFAGKYYSTDNLISRPTPVQRPHPPILLGGGGRRMLSLAAREADIVSLNLRTTSEGMLDFASLAAAATREKIEWIRAAAGDRFSELEINHPVLFVAITDDREGAAAEFLKGWGPIAASATPSDVVQSPHALIGSVEQIIEDLQMRRELLGLSYITILGGIPDPAPFASVVARLAGK